MQADYQLCHNASSYVNWMQWNYCADLTSYVFYNSNASSPPPPSPKPKPPAAGREAVSLHLAGILEDMFTRI